MAKVYILLKYGKDRDTIEGVFSDKDKALKERDDLAEQHIRNIPKPLYWGRDYGSTENFSEKIVEKRDGCYYESVSVPSMEHFVFTVKEFEVS